MFAWPTPPIADASADLTLSSAAGVQIKEIGLRILFVAIAQSIHTARFVSQIADQGWDLHLFPSMDFGMAHSQLRNITVHHSLYGKQGNCGPGVRFRGVPVGFHRVAWFGRGLLKAGWPMYRLVQLEWLVRCLQPDIIHSMEIRHAGYLTLEARERLGDRFPTWLVTNWGSDIHLFGRLREHAGRIKAVLSACDDYSCECRRDVQLAMEMGLEGEVLPTLPNTGGFDLARVAQFRQPGATSARRLVLLKGYQGWAGRGLVGLRALALCASELRGYRVAFYSAEGEDVEIAAELVSCATGLPVEVIPPCSHDDMLRLHGRARIYIGLSISDGISASLLEAMVMGAFPIQSCTSCADEWIVDGETGFIVPPEDPQQVAKAIRHAVADDDLVDRAARRNAQVAAERLGSSLIQPQVIAMYEKMAARGR